MGVTLPDLTSNPDLKIFSSIESILSFGAPAEMYTCTKRTLYYIIVFGQIPSFVMAPFLFVLLLYPLKLTNMYVYILLHIL